MLKQRWDRFMCPNGIQRTFNPRKWEHGTLVLVLGELMALLAAVAAIPVTLLSESSYGQWLLYAAAVMGAGALFWYALNKSTLGEMPLTGISARRISAVIQLREFEKQMGSVFDWDTISGDGKRLMWEPNKMKPEVKERLFEIILASKLRESVPEMTQEQAIQLLRSMSESETQQLIDQFFPLGTLVPFTVGTEAEDTDT